MADLFADAAEKQTVDQYIKQYDERTKHSGTDRYKVLLAARARGYTAEQLRDECSFINVHRHSMSAAMVSLHKIMLNIFQDELKKRETAESLGVRRRESVPMTHRMRLVYHGERY
ncbi:hypothetical protein JCM8208_006839 [Rhodotorula glutinis]